MSLTPFSPFPAEKCRRQILIAITGRLRAQVEDGETAL
jgi:hypothetical protein